MNNNSNFKKWLTDLQLNHPLVIAGPCSAETEEQVMATAHLLKDTDTTFYRAGIWKPRTRPGMFEGVGVVGLPWLKRVKEETGLKTATEVANAMHVEQALKFDIDLLWIGARSAVSPFIVQEIAEALQGTDKIVLVKNPVNPDLPLWLGAVERLYQVGIEKLGVIHRGFSSYHEKVYRNKPKWPLAIELRKQFPDLPLILDPSHICGKRELIFEVCQTGLDLNYDGFMIETHVDPTVAWSDAAQQITPQRLAEITRDLKVKQPQLFETEYLNQLKVYRKELDQLDQNLIELLATRMQIAEQIGKLKQDKNVTILQSDRWNQIMDNMISSGTQRGLSTEFIDKLFKAIHLESIQHQQKVK
jgi:chorismate mutase